MLTVVAGLLAEYADLSFFGYFLRSPRCAGRITDRHGQVSRSYAAQSRVHAGVGREFIGWAQTRLAGAQSKVSPSCLASEVSGRGQSRWGVAGRGLGVGAGVKRVGQCGVDVEGGSDRHTVQFGND